MRIRGKLDFLDHLLGFELWIKSNSVAAMVPAFIEAIPMVSGHTYDVTDLK